MDIEVAQALYTIDRLPGEQLPDLAMDLLSQGIDTIAVRELAGLQRPTVPAIYSNGYWRNWAARA